MKLLKALPKSTLASLFLLAVVTIFAIGNFVLGYTEPTTFPPGGNVTAPLNMGTTRQVKQGELGSSQAIIVGWPSQPDYKLVNSSGTLQFNCTSTATGCGATPTRLVIGQDGNVGIGTTGPSTKLQVSGGDGSLALFGPNATWNAYLYVGASGNQITTDRAQVIATNGNLHLDSATNRDTYINYYSQRPTFINPQGGNVGIGTTSPGAKLDVAGQIKATEGIDVGNAGGAYSYITMRDDESPNGVKYVHANSNAVGFLSGAGSWLSYWDNAGNMNNIGGATFNGNVGIGAGAGLRNNKLIVTDVGSTSSVGNGFTLYAVGATQGILGQARTSSTATFGVQGYVQGNTAGSGVGGVGYIGGEFQTNNGISGYNLQLPARNNAAQGVYLYVSSTGCPINSALALQGGFGTFASRICVVNY